MLIRPQVVCSKSEIVNETQRMSIAKAVVYRDVDKKAWDAIAKENQGLKAVVVVM